jgi:N-acyl-D-aspartate/D-glutamate deacylase
MTEYDLIIRNGTILDGTRLPAYRADLAILNGVVTFEEGNCTGALPGKLLRSTDVAA